ncbi:MAG: helix-turn-helix domain-containing protein [Hungatella sp.]|jgi:transcriptional regulator with XRE-family HTH domain|nr:helix-turn-helix domain-containing protein [Hungatella sp.]
MYIGDRLKDLRISKNLTQSELAELLQVTKSAVSSYENDTRLPSIDVLVKMSKIFHVTIDNILGNKSNDVIDVAGLTDKQRNNVQDIITTYKLNNKMIKHFKVDSQKLNTLLNEPR